jgi:hypothetical protein
MIGQFALFGSLQGWPCDDRGDGRMLCIGSLGSYGLEGIRAVSGGAVEDVPLLGSVARKAGNVRTDRRSHPAGPGDRTLAASDGRQRG